MARRVIASAWTARRGRRPPACVYAPCPGTGRSRVWPERWRPGPHREGDEPKPVMHGREKSDPSIVAGKPANGVGRPEPELVERREGAKENTGRANTRRTPSRVSVPPGLDRVRTAARLDGKERFTALLHHVDAGLLHSAYSWLKRDAAPGVDGVTWQEYGQDLERKLADLHGRIHRGAYRAQPSRRHYVPKPDGRRRPLGIAALEDKIVQRAMVEVLNAISSGSRTGSGPDAVRMMHWTRSPSGSATRGGTGYWTPTLPGSSMRSATRG